MSSDEPPRSARLDLALAAVGAACRVTHRVQLELQASDARTKSDASPVTVADFAAQAVIATHLGVSFVGEESAELLEQDQALTDRILSALSGTEITSASSLREAVRLGEGDCSPEGFWTLDPVDGTKGFLRNAHYCVSLAWVEGDRPTVGVLGCPRLGATALEGSGVLLGAVQGGGAWTLGPDSPPTRVSTAAPGGPVVIAESAEKSHTDHSLGAKLLAHAGLLAAEPVRVDSQVKYGVLARGQAHVFLRKTRSGYVEKIWDHAAGSLIAEEGGATVTDLDGLRLDFSKGQELVANRGVLAAPAPLHGALLAALRTFESSPCGKSPRHD